MSDLRDLYQEIILDHSRKPKNFGRLESATHHAEGYNPLCGDRVEVFLVLDGERVSDIRFAGQGCAISTASASLMTEALKGKTVGEALALFRKLHETVTGSTEATTTGRYASTSAGTSASAGSRSAAVDDRGAGGVTAETNGTATSEPDVDLGKLAVLEGVRQYPLRVKCATLAWHALRNAIIGQADEVAVTE